MAVLSTLVAFFARVLDCLLSTILPVLAITTPPSAVVGVPLLDLGLLLVLGLMILPDLTEQLLFLSIPT